MSKNGKSSLTPKAKGAAMRNREKMYYKALSFGRYNKPKSIADLCHEAWAAGYFYAKQESEGIHRFSEKEEYFDNYVSGTQNR